MLVKGQDGIGGLQPALCLCASLLPAAANIKVPVCSLFERPHEFESRHHRSHRTCSVCGRARAVTPVTPVTVSAQGAKTQWDGVYTEEQAKRGETLYAEKCSQLPRARHERRRNGARLDGRRVHVELERPVAGRPLRAHAHLDAAERPGSLSRQENADILAFMLNKGNYPPGQTELPTQTEVLNRIKFVAVKP